MPHPGKILVTGGAGYIGAHTVVQLYNAGYEPIIIDNLSRSDSTLLEGIELVTKAKVKFHRGNCIDRDFLRHIFKTEKNITAVIHFAAYKSVGESVQNPLIYYHNNLESLVSLLSVMQEAGVTDLIFSSSCTVYGQPDHIPVPETAPFKNAESPYGATKQMCERILEDCFQTGFRFVSLRYFNPIGAHASGLLGELPMGTPNNLVPYITQTAIGKRDQLIVFGNDYNTPDGTCLRDFIHVTDLAEAHVKSIEFLATKTEKVSYDAFNLGTGKPCSVLELITQFESVTGTKLNYAFGSRRPGDVEKTYADPKKAREYLKWAATFTIQDALLHAWNWEKRLANR